MTLTGKLVEDQPYYCPNCDRRVLIWERENMWVCEVCECYGMDFETDDDN